MVVNLQQLNFFPKDLPLLQPTPTMARQMGVRGSRQRGIVLTDRGWQKLLEMKVLQNRYGEWHTYDLLGDAVLLSPRTVSKIVGREIGVDRRTLKQLFDAFNLALTTDDYCLPSCGVKSSSNLIGRALPLALQKQNRQAVVLTLDFNLPNSYAPFQSSHDGLSAVFALNTNFASIKTPWILFGNRSV
jgi:hypothetical protein